MDEATLLQTLDTAEREGWTELDLRGYGLTIVPDRLCKLTNLRKLILTENHLKGLPECLSDLVNLEFLDVGGNDLEVLPESITALVNLEILGLGNNDLTAVPENIGNLTHLYALDLADNHVSRLPDSIGRLTRLDQLGLGVNQLTHLPEGISNLTKLKTLYLNQNQLTTLPDDFSRLTVLRSLHLSNNQLTTIPASICDLPGLRYLWIADNQLTSLPDNLGESGTLLRLWLADNPSLSSVPPRLDVGMLSIAGCSRITSLPEGIVVRQVLDLADTGLTALPDSLEVTELVWYGITIDQRIAFHPETLTAQEILDEPNAERRRVMLERMGDERFIRQANPAALDTDRDAGGERRLLRMEFEDEEPLVFLDVHDPSTGRQYLLRVPPNITTCHQAAAWVAGFDNPDDYRPLLET